MIKNAQDIYNEMIEAYKNKDTEIFIKASDKFLEIADDMEYITSGNKYYLLGRWIEQAKQLADDTDDFTRKIYQFNAKALVTTWGSYSQSEIGGLHDYSNRQWSGLIGDFYKVRWKWWIDARINELQNKPYEKDINWFEWEWKWVRQNKEYPTAVNDIDLHEISKRFK